MKVQIPLKQLSDHQINTYLSISLKITYISTKNEVQASW